MRAAVALTTALLLLAFDATVADFPENARFDCYPETGATQQGCEARGCTWSPINDAADPDVPWCVMDPSKHGYTVTSASSGSSIQLSQSGSPSPWSTDFPNLDVNYAYIGATLNVRIAPTGVQRYEPPIGIPKQPSVSSSHVTFVSTPQGSTFSFKVTRDDTGRAIFDTSLGGLIFADKFIQIATNLASENVYGWGENIHQQVKHDFSRYYAWAMFARDEPPNSAGVDTKNLYGVQPFYMVVEPDGKTHGVLILNSNAQEVFTTPGPALIYRTIGGILDLYFFPGPTPAEVTAQYLALVGKPFVPAYWSLGFQLCRYGYNGLSDMQAAIDRQRSAGIPIDVTYADIDYMDRFKDFTTGVNWTQFPQYTNTLHNEYEMKLILIFDPAIEADYAPFQRGIQTGARFIEWERQDQVPQAVQSLYPMAANTKVMLGVVWPDRHVGFPDFLDTTSATNTWWINEFVTYHQQLAFDGIWIDMNEPSNFGTNDGSPVSKPGGDMQQLKCPLSGADSTWDIPPYQTQAVYRFGFGNVLSTKTLCMLAKTAAGTQRFYDTKNLYGWSESRATFDAVHQATGKRGTVISRSTFPSSGRYAGHWLGDNTARWEDLRTSVIGAQEFNLFGIPYVGSDVCGFIGTSNEELCLRWQQLGAFHSFYRNHNTFGAPPQDPAQWATVAAATRKANLFRYSYLPYLYSLHFRAALSGTTVIRPVWYEYPSDSDTYNLSYQFMWGPAMLVAPVVTQGATSVSAYLPGDRWYSLFDQLYGQAVQPGKGNFAAPWTSQTPTFARGGKIVPRQGANVTTTASRRNPFELLIPLQSDGNGNWIAAGELFWDDGDSVIDSLDTYKYYNWQFSFATTSKTATLTVTRTSTGNSTLNIPPLNTLEVLGYEFFPDYTSFLLNGQKVTLNTQTSTYNALSNRLTINTSPLVPIDSSQPATQTLTWSHQPKQSQRRAKMLAANKPILH